MFVSIHPFIRTVDNVNHARKRPALYGAFRVKSVLPRDKSTLVGVGYQTRNLGLARTPALTPTYPNSN